MRTHLQFFLSLRQGIQIKYQALSAAQRYGYTIFLLIFFALLLTGGVQYYISHTVISPSYGGTYREGIVGSAPRLVNPILASNDADKTLARIIYPSLLSYDAEENLVPSIAQSYNIENGGKRYHFVLKHNLAWDDGAPLTASDVIFTITVIQDASYDSPLRQNWLGVKTTQDGDYDVLFDLPSAYPPFLQNATLGILPKHIWGNIPASSFALAEANTKPVGAGPYRFDAFQKDASGTILSYTLTRNDRYEADRAYLDEVKFTFYHNQEDASRAYQNKAIDGLGLLYVTDVSRLQDIAQATTYKFIVPRYFALFFNQSQHQALQDSAVRQALEHATDKQALVRDVLAGNGQVVQGPLLPFMRTYDAQAKTYPFDIEQAKNILDADKWVVPAGGDGVRVKQPSVAPAPVRRKKTAVVQAQQPMRLEFTLATADAPELVQTAKELQKQWQQIGVKLNIQTYPLSDLQQNIIATRQYQILLFGQFLNIDPDPFSFWHSSQVNSPGLNLALYSNKDVDKLLESARSEQDPDKRMQGLRAFQEHIASDIPAIFLYEPSFLYLTRKTTQGIQGAVLADTSWRLARIGTWYVETQRTLK